MLKKVLCAIFLALAANAPARADKLIWIPTADMSKLKAEYMRRGSGDEDLITAQIGLGRGFELLGRRYQHVPGRGDSTELGGELQVLPEGFATPGLALGVWDVAGNTPRGRRVFAVLTKTAPVVNWLPVFVKDIKFHLGAGTGSLSGVFVGAQASIPLGLTLVGEFDTSRTNFGLWWTPVPPLRLKAESWGGKFSFGVQLISPL